MEYGRCQCQMNFCHSFSTLTSLDEIIAVANIMDPMYDGREVKEPNRVYNKPQLNMRQH